MRLPISLLALLVCSAAAAACPADRQLFLVRETDGLEFVPSRYGTGTSGAKLWSVYDGRSKGRRLYFSVGKAPGSAMLSTSGDLPPAANVKWGQTMPEPAAYGFTVSMQEGPLEGEWRSLCRPR